MVDAAAEPHEGGGEFAAAGDLVADRRHGVRPASATQERQVVGRVDVLGEHLGEVPAELRLGRERGGQAQVVGSP